MTKMLWRFVLVLPVLMSLATSAQATVLGNCQEGVCNQNSYCNDQCYLDLPGGREYHSCFDWTGGNCYTPCHADWQVASSTAVVGFQQEYYSPDSCDYIVGFLVTYTDVNDCGEPDFTACQYSTQGSRSDHLCCNYWYCWGSPC
jgi:hypothetical protein